MPESKNITITIGRNDTPLQGLKMMPLIQDYPDYMATYNMEDTNANFFTTTLNKYDSNIYTFFKPNVSFAQDDAIVQISKAFDKDAAVMAVVCDGFYKRNFAKKPYYLDTNQLTNIDNSIPISFHKNIAKQIEFQKDVYKTLVETLNSCVAKQLLIIHIAEPLVVINE